LDEGRRVLGSHVFAREAQQRWRDTAVLEEALVKDVDGYFGFLGWLYLSIKPVEITYWKFVIEY